MLFIDLKLITKTRNMESAKYKIWFFSNLVGEEGPRIPGVQDSRVCFFNIFIRLFYGGSLEPLNP